MLQENPKPAPKVSVIVPVFNAEAYLRQCLESSCGQSLREIEIICVNDGSTDDSLKILEEFAANDSRIRVLSQKNARQGAARNRALNEARGEYVAFLDSDDEFASPFALEKLYGRAGSGALDMLMLSCVRVDETGRERPWSYHAFSSFLPKTFPCECFSWRDCSPALFWRMPCSCWGSFYSRKFLEKNALRFPERIFFEDRPFFFFALAAAERVGIFDERLYRYRENPSSTIAGKGKHLASNIEQGLLIFRNLRERGFSSPFIEAGIVAHAHDLLKSLGLCPPEILCSRRERLRAAFEEMFPQAERAPRLAALPNAQDRACARLILGDATPADRLVVRFSALKYSLLKHVVSGERRSRYVEKSGLSRKIFCLKNAS